MRLNNIIEGVQIVAKHTDDQFCVQAEHDQVWCGGYDLPLSEAEKARMVELGWFEAEDSWSFFT